VKLRFSQAFHQPAHAYLSHPLLKPFTVQPLS
jgi:hypothetical protein